MSSSVHDEMVRSALRHAQRGRNDRALNELEKVVRASPDHAFALRELGTLLHRLDRSEEALARLTRAAQIAPADAVTNRALATVARSVGQLEVAAEAWLRAPRDAQALNELAVVRQEQGQLDAAIAHFREALSVDPSFAAAHSNLLLCLNYHDACTDAQLFAEHEAFGRRFGGDAVGFATPQAADGPIRVGYLSPDFFSHSVSFFIMPVLGCHDRSRFSVTCYSDVRRADEVTALIRARADTWRETTKLSDEQLAQQILADRIDILVDLAGHTLHNRLPMFANRRLAPVQVTYLGYPNTTGLRTIDYRITDATADPLGISDALHTERLVRLSSGSFFTSIDLADAPDPVPLPAEKRPGGQITFAVATNWSKVRPAMLRLYARLVGALPNARLLLQSRSLADPPTRDAAMRTLRDAGLSDDRVELRAWADFPQYARMLAEEVDIVLDTFPFNGHTTTWQALWLGVPVVTLAGRAAHRSRMGASILTNVGLSELVAHEEEEFVKIATDLASDLPRLRDLRVGLRDRMRRSVIQDGAGFTRDLESAYLEMISTAPAVGVGSP